VKKRSRPENNGQSESTNEEAHDMETAPLLEVEFEEQDNAEVSDAVEDQIIDEVEDITDSIITQLITEEELQKLQN
jgi:hypothetical protein